jgi:thymidylate synthase (methanogen type)
MGLPVILVEAETCGEAWEKTLKEVWIKGLEIQEPYEGVSKEATVTVNVLNPLAEPRFSRKDFVSVAMFLMGDNKKRTYREKQYVRDLIDGDMDFRVREGIEAYTYHERLFNYGLVNPKHRKLLISKGLPFLRFFDPKTKEYLSGDEGINQMEYLIRKAMEQPISRKLQVTTWEPHKDLIIKGAPCLQRIWIRIIEERDMVFQTFWRSRDLYKAFGSNVFGMVELAKWLAERLNLRFIQYVDVSSSLHIYSSDFEAVTRHFEVIQKRKTL